MGSVFSILRYLPDLLFFFQLIFYPVLAWFFGSISIKGLKKHLNVFIRTPLAFVVGFLCIISGSVISGYVRFFNEPVFELFQLNLIFGSLVSSIIFFVGFYMISYERKEDDKDSIIKKLKTQIELLESILVKHNIPTLSEKDVKKTAEGLVQGYKATNAKLKGSFWEIYLEKNGKKATVVLDGYTGEVKDICREKDRMNLLISNPVKTSGIIIIAGLILFSLINFRGLPDMMEGFASMMGMKTEDLNTLMGRGGNMPEGCISASTLFLTYGMNIVDLPISHDENAKKMIERETGKQVVVMYDVKEKGKDYILAIALNKSLNFSKMSTNEIIKNADICSATKDRLCNCLKIPEIGL